MLGRPVKTTGSRDLRESVIAWQNDSSELKTRGAALPKSKETLKLAFGVFLLERPGRSLPGLFILKTPPATEKNRPKRRKEDEMRNKVILSVVMILICAFVFTLQSHAAQDTATANILIIIPPREDSAVEQSAEEVEDETKYSEGETRLASTEKDHKD